MTEGCGPENQKTPEQNGDEKFHDKLARYLCLGIITDDNYSETNDLSGLEQIIFFEYNLDPDSESDYERLEKIKAEIFQVIETKYLGGHDSKFDKEALFEEAESAYEHGDAELLQGYIHKNWRKRKYEAWIDKLAKGLIEGVIKDIEPSNLSNYTGLEQIIIAKTNLHPDDIGDHYILLELIKANVRSRVTDFSGGNRFPETTEEVLDLDIAWERNNS
jgi:hypothetical protein